MDNRVDNRAAIKFLIHLSGHMRNCALVYVSSLVPVEVAIDTNIAFSIEPQSSRIDAGAA